MEDGVLGGGRSKGCSKPTRLTKDNTRIGVSAFLHYAVDHDSQHLESFGNHVTGKDGFWTERSHQPSCDELWALC